MARLLLKTDCDVCGCAFSWAGVGGRDGGPTDWETIDSKIVSAASPNWDFGARGGGIWKVTAYPSTVGGLNQLGGRDGTYYDDLNWNSGGVTMDNAGGRDRSYLLQYDVAAKIWAIQANGHYSPTVAAPRPTLYPYRSASDWGHSFDQSGAYRNNALVPSTTPPPNVGAIFVWMPGVTHYSLPAKITGDTNDNAATALKDIFRRHILSHTSGGTIAGSISNVTTSQRTSYLDLSDQTWEVRLHKLGPVSDTIWLDNQYPKAIKSLRLKRWTGHAGAVAPSGSPAPMPYLHCAWVFPLWHFDLALTDRVAPPSMNACSLHHFKASMDAPVTWTPEGSYRGGNTTYPFLQAQPLTFSAPSHHQYWSERGTVGVVRGSNWTAWTVTPIFDDDTLGDETILGHRESPYSPSRPSGLRPPQLTTIVQDKGAGGKDFGFYGLQKVTDARGLVGFGCGFRSPQYYGGSGAFPGTREHTSSLGGVPVCVDFGTLGPGLTNHVRTDSGYLDTDGEAVSF